MKQKELICIGGPADGRRVADDGRNYYEMRLLDSPEPTFSEDEVAAEPDKISFRKFTYKRVHYRDDGGDFFFLTPIPSEVKSPLRLLLEKYPGEEEKIDSPCPPFGVGQRVCHVEMPDLIGVVARSSGFWTVARFEGDFGTYEISSATINFINRR